MRRFSYVIDELDMKDISFKGGLFTWSGGLNNQRMTRLNRFLISDDWDLSFGGSTQSLLPRPISNHFLFCLKGWGFGGRANVFKIRKHVVKC